MLVVETRGQIVGDLTTHRQYHAVGLLKVEYVHDSLECKLIEIEAVAEVVVGRYGLGVVVDHHRSPALFFDRKESIDRAPVELYRASYTVSA